MTTRIFIGVFLFLSTLLTAQQNNVLTTLIDPKLILENGSLEDILSDIEAHYNITFSYSTSQFDLNQNIQVKTVDALPLNAYLKEIFYKYQIKLKSNENKVIITGELKKIRVFGFIRDQASGESLAGSIIINKNSNEVYSPNSTGYYSLTINTDSALIETRVLGYLTDSVWVIHQGRDKQLDVKLKFNNKLGTVTVSRNVQDNLIYDPGGTLVTIDKIYGNKGISGEEDIVHSLKMHDGVTSGVEGGLGININGGNIDQNLILFDGMPLYEISHIAGINSIFLNESIQSVNLMKTGIPARYNGRLSSVIDVRLKDGHSESPKRSISLGLTGAKFGFEGPLNSSQSTTFNLSGRASLLNYTLRPIANKFTNFENVNLDFFDIVGKITHRFDKKNKLSLTTYFGGDRIKLIQNDTLQNINFKSSSRDINELKWGNKLVSINYGSILNSKIKFNVQGGWASYNYFSNGYYEFFSNRDSAEIDRVIDVVSYSSIHDFQLNASMDFYLNDQIKLKSGASAIRHIFKPSVRQSLIKVNEDLSKFEAPDTSIVTNEVSAFTEINFQIGKYIYVYPGVNINSYFVEDHVHHTIQPRAKLLIVPAPNTIISTSFSRMAQNLHLLSNPGLGIASDLWVPSTKQYKPSISNQIDIEFKQTISEGINLGFTWYNKNMRNLLVYSVPIDLHANIVIQEQSEVFLTNESDWKKNVEVGKGTSTGFSVSLKKETGKFKGWVSYHNNSNKRIFENLNDGNSFSAKHERPHDLNIALSYELTSKLVLGVNWVYTSGGTFSLPNEQFLTNVGLEVLRPDGRNNFRLPAYHQMSISGEYEFKMFKTRAHLNFGIYNIYNRLNPFFLYATNDPTIETPLLKKVSIFPILPFASITWQW